MTKYFKLKTTVNDLLIFIKIDEWNGDVIKHYGSCTLFNGTVVYLININSSNERIEKKIFDKKFLSINEITIVEEITEQEWQKIIDDI